MNRLGIIAALVAIIVVILGCASDIQLPEDRLLEGDYEGVYTMTTDFGSPSQVTEYNHIFWTFLEKTYVMEIDVDNNTGHCFCRVDGLWRMDEGVRLQEEHSQPFAPADCNACNEDENPEGIFVREWAADTLVLKLQDGTTFKELRMTLVKDPEPEE